MSGAFGEGPDDPGIDRADTEVFRPLRIDEPQQMGELRGRLVRSESKTVRLQHEAVADGTQVLPTEPGGKWLSRGPVPHD
ncbi:unannotated protein [freshwater metagenome]|uniref:Unannotated protein n=1 Tax=freshwater metagenome TaxID=449393 RepID=A0A6J7JM38_9ZZZZ